MNLPLDPALVTAWVAAAARCLGFFLVAPMLTRQIPRQIRAAFAALLAFMVTPLMVDQVPAADGVLQLAALGLGELGLGLAMGFMAMLVYAALHLAGTMMGFQIGTGVSQLFDPQLGASSSEMGRLITAIVGFAVVAAGGHHLVVHGLLTSFEMLPVGGSWLEPDLARVATRLMGGMLLAGCEMAIPVVAVTTLSTLAIALSVRATPQLNIYFALGIMLNLVLGLTVSTHVIREPLGGIDEVMRLLLRAMLLPVQG